MIAAASFASTPIASATTITTPIAPIFAVLIASSVTATATLSLFADFSSYLLPHFLAAARQVAVELVLALFPCLLCTRLVRSSSRQVPRGTVPRRRRTGRVSYGGLTGFSPTVAAATATTTTPAATTAATTAATPASTAAGTVA